MNKTEIREFIQSNRTKGKPLSIKSINAYVSTLTNLYKNIFGDIPFDVNAFNDYATILNFMKDITYNLRKSKLSAILTVATDEKAINEYKKLLIKDATKYDKEQDKNLFTEQQKKVHLPQDAIHDIGAGLKTEFDTLLKDITNGTKKYGAYAYNDLQKYILYLLTSGEYLEPRRLLEWTELTIGKINKSTEGIADYNIYDPRKGKMMFSTYKTSEPFGVQIFDIPKHVKSYLNKWIKINNISDGGFLFNTIKGEKLTPHLLSTRLKNIYGASVNMLRHSYISSKYENVPTVEAITETATKMGHGLKTHLKYMKK